MVHYLDPKNDLTFKRIFGEHEHLCMSLLNSMLPLEKDQRIVSLKYQPGELIPEIPLLKNSIVDVCCTDNSGRRFIVEMQMHWTESFKSRVLLNASKAYVKQLDSGEDYRLIQPVYALNFVNDTFDPDESVYYHDYKVVNIANVEKQKEGLELVFIELPKFRPTNRADRKLYDLWLMFLTQIRNASTEVPAELLDNEVVRDAVQYLERNSYTKAQLETYDKYLDAIRVERTFYVDALAKGLKEGEAIGIEKGEAIGIEKGEAIGIEKGEAIGIEKGRAEGKAEGKAEVVIACSRNGFSLEQIQLITGLKKEEIEKILHADNQI
ncbi:MAG: Rpn family recombination-promoting nuclease/putative transposase [Tannerella sp.]|jgi:predicted transposase/invertase (TIGR01784 family)|nr:Rpn family recombination-promoting nuclease/putative transposase [Tannerella sp.]